MSTQHPWGSLLQRWVGVLFLAVAVWGPTAAWAQDHILEKSFWTDTTGSASFEQARSAPYTPYKGVLSKGFSRDVQWVRLKIDGVEPGVTDKLVLRIRPVFLDQITLFDPIELDQGRVPRATGDKELLVSAEFESLNHAFVIPAQSTPREVWLRLTTTSTQLMHVEVLSPREMLRQEHGLWLVYSALLAFILSFLVWVFLAWLRDRDPVNCLFVLRQAVILIFTASYLGYHRILLADVMEPASQDIFYSWMALLVTGSSFAFEYRFLREYHLPRWAHLLLNGLLIVSTSLLVLMFLGYKLIALSANMTLNGVGLITLMLVSVSLQPRQSDVADAHTYFLPKQVVVVYYLTIVLVLAFSILPSLGVFQGNMLSIYGVLLYGLISGLFMTSLLVVRSRQLERIRVEVANSLFLSREQLALETRRRQDQSQLLNMLMHELKTPLAVIDLAINDRAATEKAQNYVSRAIVNMKSILNRCVQTDRLVERPFEAQMQRFDLARQLQQWVQDNPQAEQQIALQVVKAAPVDTDLQCVQIIFSNLIENALKYGDQQHAVLVSLEAKPHANGRSGWCLQVCNAPGVAGLPDTEKVFAKYYRSAAAQRQSGTGLGLFLSHNLAQQIGAELRYQPTDTHICFELWLPT